MDFIRRLGSFWIVLLFCCLGGYFCLFNLDYIYVNIPQMGEFKVRAAVAYIGCFLAGASVVILFFGFELFRKSWVIRQKNRQIRDLEKKLAASGRSAPSQDLDVNPSLNPASLP